MGCEKRRDTPSFFTGGRPLCRSYAFFFDAIDEIFPFAVAVLMADQSVDVRFESREPVVEVACEFQVIDDRPVEAFTRNQQRNAGRGKCSASGSLQGAGG